MRDGSGHILVCLLLSYRDGKVKGTYQAAETERHLTYVNRTQRTQ